jgi:PKD repeat protein
MRRPWVTLLVALSLGLLGASVAGAQPTPLTPVIGVDPTSLDFGRVCQGQSRDLTIDLFNNVSDPTSILTITELLTAAPFSLVSPPAVPFDIPGDNTRVTLTVRYTPSAGGPQNGNLSITGEEPIEGPNPVLVPLAGLGNRAPLCNAGGPYSGQVGQAVSFNGGGSSDPDGDTLTYSWDFGDGSSGTGATPTHTYATGGVFTVTLTVNDGCTSSQCSTTADINAPPVCNAGGPYTGNVGQAVSFDGTGSSDPDGTIVSYVWNFGDGSTGTGATPSHTYATGGIFTVSLTVTDNDGASSSCETTADINVPPICDANGPYSGTVGQPVQFNGTGSSDPDGTIVAYAWNFGDGSTGTGATPTHTYATGGLFTVTLVVTDNDGASASCETTADINTPPNCDADGPYSGTAGQPVQFNGTGSSDPDGTIDSYDWSFGDGSTGTGATPTHTYAAGGVFTVTLVVADDDSATATCETTADINALPICDAGGPYNGTVGVPVSFDGTGSSDPDGTIASYAWDFGDGSTGTGATPTHAYAAAGNFTVVLTVTDNDGATSTCTTTANITETPNEPPICDADGPYTGTVGVPVSFDGTGSSDPDGTIVSYVWDFGDGSPTGSGATPTHTYGTSGLFTVTLTVTDDDGGSSSCTTTADIADAPNEPPVCDANGPYNGQTGVPVSFDGTGSSDPDGTIVSYVWDFGDGSTGTGATPTHAYGLAGTYAVELCVTDDDSATSCCQTSATITDAPNLPPICDANGPYTGDVGTPIQFDGSGSSDPDGTIVTYAWDFGDGETGTGATPTHVYANPGSFLARLCVTDDDGAQSCCEADVTVLPPSAVELASFTATGVGGTVTLDWTTSFEQDNLGFYVDRAESGSTAFVRLNSNAMVSAHGTGNQAGNYTYVDRTVEPGHRYVYQLWAMDLSGHLDHVATSLEVAVTHAVPTRLALNQNQPNPFNPSTAISFALPEAGHVALRIYDAQGHLVRTLVDAELPADYHVREWDGKDNSGVALGSGVYLYRLETRAAVLQQKMVLMK